MFLEGGRISALDSLFDVIVIAKHEAEIAAVETVSRQADAAATAIDGLGSLCTPLLLNVVYYRSR